MHHDAIAAVYSLEVVRGIEQASLRSWCRSLTVAKEKTSSDIFDMRSRGSPKLPKALCHRFIESECSSQTRSPRQP